MSAACLETSEPAIPIATPETDHNLSHCTKHLVIPAHYSSTLVYYAVHYMLEAQHLQGMPTSCSTARPNEKPSINILLPCEWKCKMDFDNSSSTVKYIL